MTSIEWTDRTWNCVTGCTKVSPGCKNCYAETIAERFWAKQYPGRKGFTDVRAHEERLDAPLRWRKPSRIFVNSMSDLFHENVPDTFIDRVFAVMACAYWHTFQVLTKRPGRMLSYLTDHAAGGRHVWAAGQLLSMPRGKWKPSPGWPLPNVWLGVSVENQETADELIPLLLQTPAAVRFVSVEPLLGRVDLVPWLFVPDPTGAPADLIPRTPKTFDPALSWVSVGGESGPGARPCDVAWIRSIVGQCQVAGVPCFVKQIGARPVGIHTRCAGCGKYDVRGNHRYPEQCGPVLDVSPKLRDRKGADPDEWPEGLKVREWPEVRA